MLGSRPGFGHLASGVVAVGEVAVGDGVVVHAAQGGDQVFGGAASAAGVAPMDDVGPDVLGELLDLGRGGLVEAAITPMVEDAVPVRAIDPPRADGCRHDRDVLGEGRRRRHGRSGVEEVRWRHAQAGQQQAGGIEVALEVFAKVRLPGQALGALCIGERMYSNR